MPAHLVLPSRARLLALILAAALLATAAMAVVASRSSSSGTQAATAGVVSILMKVTGGHTGVFKGDSKVKGQADQISVVDYHFEIDAPTSIGSGSGGGAGKRTYKPIVVTHVLDGASPQFLNAAATNERLTSVVINFFMTDRSGKQINYYRVTLQNAFITSVKHDTSGDTVLETDSFVFERMTQENIVDHTTFSDDLRDVA
jgi:type VI secretion system secreted protein Hcp